jgi:hypothetical protein
MDKSEFDAQLRADGYTEIETKSVAPKPANDTHGHPFAVRGLVLGAHSPSLRTAPQQRIDRARYSRSRPDANIPKRSAPKARKSW